MNRDQQKQLVMAFVEAYNLATGSSFRVERWPEEEHRNIPAVEAFASDHDRTMAVEHTLAEPFVGERQDSAIFRRVIAPIEADESLRQPNYDVTIQVSVGAIPKGIDWDETGKTVRDWLRRELALLPDGESRHSVPDLSFQLEVTVEKIQIDEPKYPGSVFCGRYAPEDSLFDVLRTALQKKLRKLANAGADLNVLLLERADVLRGFYRFGLAMNEFLAGEFSSQKPDEVWLVVTVGLEREGVLYFYKIWPIYFEHRLQSRDERLRKL